MFAVFKRELESYILTITGFIFMGFFLLVSGILFTLLNLSGPGSSDMRGTMSNITFIFLIVIPILTMRLIAEESRQKTDQLLLTSPLKLTAIIVGKYLAALSIFAATLCITLLYPLLLSRVGLIVGSELLGAYLGVFFLGCSFIAVGLFISSLTTNQVVAAVVTFSVLLGFWVMDWLQQSLPGDRTSGVVFAVILVVGAGLFLFFTIRNLYISAAFGVVGIGVIGLIHLLQPATYDGLIVKILRWISILERYQAFNRGVLDFGTLVFFLSFSGFFVFLTVRVVEKRRWVQSGR